MTDFRIRPARPGDADDRAFLREMAPRLETGLPPWIAAGALAAAVERSVLEALQAQRDGETLLVAEDAQGDRLGFIYATISRDGLSNEPLGYVSEFAVAAEAEGRGVGRALLEAVEHWSRKRGMTTMMLRVFWSNHHARDVYGHLGYEPDVLQMRKLLGAPVEGRGTSPSHAPEKPPAQVPG